MTRGSGRGTRLLAAAVMLGILGGCSVPARTAVPDSNATASSVLAALQADDQNAFVSLFAADADRERVALLWQNFSQIEVKTITDRDGDGWQIGWRVPGEDGLATHLVAPRWQCDVRDCLLEDIVQRPGSPAPIWLIEAVTIHRAGPVTLIGGGDLDGWTSIAERSADFVVKSQASQLIRPDETLVIEVPAGPSSFAQVMDATVFDFVGTGAITWIADSGGSAPNEEAAPARIVINPEAAEAASTVARYLLLVHEQTHAATINWLGYPAAGQLWVSEGLAEAVMLQASPESQQHSKTTLADVCEFFEPPPSDSDFTDSVRADVAYAWSAAAVTELLADPDATAVISRLWTESGSQPDVDSSQVWCS